MRARPVAASALRAEINVTPLVDVCLVLLIIFMVVTPMLKSTAVALPETARPEAMPESGGELSITLGEDGAIHVGSRAVAEGELPAVLAALHAVNPDRRIALKADRRLPYRSVRRVLAQLEAAHFERAGLVTEKRRP